MKRALFFFISIFFLGSCSIWYVTFSSESKSWTGQYKSHIKDDSEDGMFTFRYKGGDGNTEFKNLEIAINSREIKKAALTLPFLLFYKL